MSITAGRRNRSSRAAAASVKSYKDEDDDDADEEEKILKAFAGEESDSDFERDLKMETQNDDDDEDDYDDEDDDDERSDEEVPESAKGLKNGKVKTCALFGQVKTSAPAKLGTGRTRLKRSSILKNADRTCAKAPTQTRIATAPKVSTDPEASSSSGFSGFRGTLSRVPHSQVNLSESSDSDESEDDKAAVKVIAPTKARPAVTRPAVKVDIMTRSSLESSGDSEEAMAMASQLEDLARSYTTQLSGPSSQFDPETTDRSTTKKSALADQFNDIENLLALGEGFKLDSSTIDDDRCHDLKEALLPGKHSDMEEDDVVKEEQDQVEITVELPGGVQGGRCRDKKPFDMDGWIKRTLGKAQRELQLVLHQTHILCLVAHLRLMNRCLGAPLLTARGQTPSTEETSLLLLNLALSIVPPVHAVLPRSLNVVRLAAFVGWLKEAFPIVGRSGSSTSSGGHRRGQGKGSETPVPLFEGDPDVVLRTAMENYSCLRPEHLVFIFVLAARSLGWNARLVMNLDTVPLKVVPVPVAAPEKGAKDPKDKAESVSAPKSSSRDKKPRVGCDDSEAKDGKNEKSRKDSKERASSSKNNERGSKQSSSSKKSESSPKRSPASSKKSHQKDSKKESSRSRSKGRAEDNSSKAPKTSRSSRASKTEPEGKEQNKASVQKDKAGSSSRKRNHSSTRRNPSPVDKGGSKRSDGRSSSRARGSSSASSSQKEHQKSSSKSRGGKPEDKVEKARRSTDAKAASAPSPSKTISSKLGDKVKLSQAALKEAAKRSKGPGKRSGSDPVGEKSKRKRQGSDTENSDSEFEEEPPSPPSAKRSRKPTKAGKSATNTTTKVCQYWAEVYVQSNWVAVDMAFGRVDCAKEMEGRLNSTGSKASPKQVLYILAGNLDGSLKDVTKRYTLANYMTVTRKARVAQEWLDTALSPFGADPGSALDRMQLDEDEKVEKLLAAAPIPSSVSAFKDHPLYALKRHLLKFEAIYPPDAPTLGFIKGEAVYARECVRTLHCRVTWTKEGRVVRVDEQPYKVVKARPKYIRATKTVIKDQPLEVFGLWQTEIYMPPPAVGGKVPRNDYGNVELFKPWMLPNGTVHIPIQGLHRTAKKLNIDCAPAMVGWEFSGGGCHPVYDGYVICKEFQDILMDAWNQEVEEKAKKEASKKEKRVLENWTKLVRGLLLYQKIKKKYSKD